MLAIELIIALACVDCKLGVLEASLLVIWVARPPGAIAALRSTSLRCAACVISAFEVLEAFKAIPPLIGSTLLRVASSISLISSKSSPFIFRSAIEAVEVVIITIELAGFVI
jgi:hypothetical protein